MSFAQAIEYIARVSSLKTTPAGMDLLYKIASPSFTPRRYIPSDDFDRARLAAILSFLGSKYTDAARLYDSNEFIRAYDLLQSMKAALNSALDLEIDVERQAPILHVGKAQHVQLRDDFDALLARCRKRVAETMEENMPDSPVASDARLDWVQHKTDGLYGSLRIRSLD